MTPNYENRLSIAERSAVTVWEGPLSNGRREVRAASGAWSRLPVTWASRTQRAAGRTSPEEFVAATHSSCFAMALALRLGEHNVDRCPVYRLEGLANRITAAYRLYKPEL